METNEETTQISGEATYSAEDDKIRLYPSRRLDEELYKRVKGLGFQWAPKQGNFYAVWTPVREDVALELFGEIDAEEVTREERAQARADRFSGYGDSAAKKSASAFSAYRSIADHIPLGQPILVGHHSEKRHRRDIARMEASVGRAVELNRRAGSWHSRAEASEAHAARLDSPKVRLRRIKKLEASLRKATRGAEKGTARCDLWQKADDEDSALTAALIDSLNFDGSGLFYLISKRELTWQEAREKAMAAHQRGIQHWSRWAEHDSRRLEFERHTLGPDFVEPPKKPRKKQPPLLNFLFPEGKLQLSRRYCGGDNIVLDQVEMTKAQYAKIHRDYKGTFTSVCGNFRVRSSSRGINGPIGHSFLSAVFLIDSVEHDIPESVAGAAAKEETA